MSNNHTPSGRFFRSAIFAILSSAQSLEFAICSQDPATSSSRNSSRGSVDKLCSLGAKALDKAWPAVALGATVMLGASAYSYERNREEESLLGECAKLGPIKSYKNESVGLFDKRSISVDYQVHEPIKDIEKALEKSTDKPHMIANSMRSEQALIKKSCSSHDSTVDVLLSYL